jgi:OOP family OmpA-OmpF porin
MRALIAIALLACGVLLSTSLNHDKMPAADALPDASPLAEAALSVSITPGEVKIHGTSASAAHEAALHQLAEEQFDGFSLEAEFEPAVLPGKNWEAVSNRLLYAIATLDSGEAQMAPGSIRIRGVSSDANAYGARIEFLRELLPDHFELQTDVMFVRSSATFDELCQRAFAELTFGPVSFAESSAEIQPGSLVTLDRITDFAHDCPGATIMITGHTDASGDESWNRQLSLARAQAVADHIAARGIDPRRLLVAGLGSSEPIADNATALGRELNRRIEFELR